MSKAKILIVEDELVIALSIKKSLEKLGYEVTGLITAGEEAVDKAREQNPDLILMDIILSGTMDGIEAARRIRKGSDIPIIYLSANADSATVDRARDTFPYGYLNKPINERDLITNIDSSIYKHRMERRIHESEEKYRNLIENINDIIVSLDENGTITYISPQTYEISGFKAEEIVGDNFLKYVHPDEQQKLIHLLEKSKTGVNPTGEYRVISKTGETLWLRVSGRPNFIDDRFVGVRAILSDITKQKKAEETAMQHETARKLAEDGIRRSNEELTAANEELQAIIEELEATSQELESQNRELVRTQTDLANREALLESIFRAAPTGIGIVYNRMIDWANKKLCIMTGYTEEELKGQSARILYPTDEDYEYVGREKYAQIQKMGTGTVETRWKHKDGTIFDVLLSSTPLDMKDLTAGVVFTALDITEVKKAEEKLAKTMERYRLLTTNVPHNLWVIDINTLKFVYSNPNMENVLGYNDNETLNRHIKDMMTPQSYDLAMKVLGEELARNGTSGSDRIITLELEQYHKNGSIVDIEITAKLLRDHTGKVTGILGISRDITDRKRAQTALEDSEKKFRMIIEDSPIPISIMDNKTGAFTYINKATTDILGYTLDDYSNIIEWEAMVYPDPVIREKRHDDWANAFRAWDHTQGFKTYELDIRCKNGSQKRIEFQITPLGDQTVIIMNDLTEKKIQQEMMIQTEKMMSLGGMAAGMAHEINNPLGIILQGIQGALSRLEPTIKKNRETAVKLGTDLKTILAYLKEREILEYLNGIQDAGLRAAKIITNMLQFSRRSESNIAPVDINLLIDKTIEMATNDYDLRKRYDFKMVQIIREYYPKLPRVSCSEIGIEQVVLNLLKNSSQAMANMRGKGFNPTISIKTGMEGQFACIQLSDNGPGIEKNIQERIFEPFYTTKKSGMGTGLGLSVSKHIITKIHHGQITCESDVGKGATFTIKLPIKRSQ